MPTNLEKVAAVGDLAPPYSFWASGPPVIKDNAGPAHRLAIGITTASGQPGIADILEGEISIWRVRAGIATLIVNLDACSKSTGLIYYDYEFPKASWQECDEYRAVFSGQEVTVGGTAYALLPIYVQGCVEAAIIAVGAVSDAAPATTDFDTNLTEVTNNHYNGILLRFTSGANAGQAHLVDVYTGASKNMAFATSDQWTDAPANGDTFVLLSADGAYLKKIFTAMALAATALSNATWTDARAGYLDNLSGGAVALASVLGALNSAAATGVVTETDVVMAYIKQLVTNLSDVRAAYLDNLIATDVSASHNITTVNDTVETDVFEITGTGIYKLSVLVDVNALIAASEGGTVTFRFYNKIDTSTYRLIKEVPFIVGSDTEHPSYEKELINHNVKMTVQCSNNVTVTRAIIYRYIIQDME